MLDLYTYYSNYARRDLILKKNINNVKILPEIDKIEILCVVKVDDLSDYWLLMIIEVIELLEVITKQKLEISYETVKSLNSFNKKKEIYLKVILRNQNLKNFLEYYYYVLLPITLCKQDRMVLTKKNNNTMSVTIDNPKIIYGISIDFFKKIVIKFGINKDMNVYEFISLLGLLKEYDKNK